MKFKLIIFLTLVFCNYYSQTYKNLNKYKGFKEIWIGEDISKYKSNAIKILKNDKKCLKCSLRENCYNDEYVQKRFFEFTQ